jgi:hypothetical protein
MNIGGCAGSTEHPTDNSGGKKLSPKTYLRRTSSRMPRNELSQGRTRLADSVQSVVTWMRFHTKSKLRDKTPRGKQLVHALTEVGITLWQKNWRECRDCEAARTGCRTPYRIPLPRQMQHDFSENSAGRQHSRRNQVWSWEPAHWITCWFRFAQNFESPSNGKSDWRNLRGWPDAASNASAARYPLRTAPSIVAGQSVRVQSPAR